MTRSSRDAGDTQRGAGAPAPPMPWRTLPAEPDNIFAERAALGAILLSPRVAAQALPLLRAEHFTHPWHRHLLDALRAVHQNTKPLDAITAHAELRRRGVTRYAERDTGVLLANLIEATPTAGSGMYYVAIVLEYAARRRLVQAAVRLAQAAGDGHGDLDQVMRVVTHEIACVRAAVDTHHRTRPRDQPAARRDPTTPAPGNGRPRPPATRDIDL
jgi:replicative DNA helicase